MLGTEVMTGRLDSLLRFIDIENALSREAIGFIAGCFSCDELINSIGLSGLHTKIQVPARPSRKAQNGRGADRLDCCREALPVRGPDTVPPYLLAPSQPAPGRLGARPSITALCTALRCRAAGLAPVRRPGTAARDGPARRRHRRRPRHSGPSR